MLLFGCAPRSGPQAAYERADRLRKSGDLDQALGECDRALASIKPGAAGVWAWRFRALKAEILLPGRDTPAGLRLVSEDPPDNLNQPALQARILADRAYGLYLLRQKDEAGRLLDRAHELARGARDDSILALVLVFRAIPRIESHELDRAEADLRAAVEAARRAGDSYREASARATLAQVYLLRYRFDESLEWSSRALEIIRREDYGRFFPLVLNNIGWCDFRLGDLEGAEKAFTEAEARLGKLGNVREQQVALGNLGSVRHSEGDYAGAANFYQRALAITERLGRKDSAQWLNNLAVAYLDAGDLSRAESYNRRAMEITKGPEEASERAWSLNGAARIAAARGDFKLAENAFRRALAENSDDPAEQWEIHAGLADLYAPVRESAAREEYQKAIAIIDRRWSSFINDSSKLTFPVHAARFYQRYVDFLMDRRREAEALGFVEAHRARLLVEKTGAQRTTELPALARARGEILLSYWLASQRSYLWVVAPGKPIRSFRLASRDRICAAVDAYSKAVLDLQDPAAPGRALYDLAAAPARDLLPAGVSLAVVPDDCLNGVNLEATVTPQGRFWVEDVTLEIAPSLRLLDPQPKAPAERDSILLLGNPPASEGLVRLPFAGDEIKTIASLYPKAVVRAGPEARPEAYQQANPARFPYIHFAAHALPNRTSPLDSSIVLSGGRLYARDIETVPLADALVAISACQSAGAKTYPGEGLVGFAWAFLTAGASGVIGSLWDVNDRSTAKFMAGLYKRLRDGESPAAALRAVKLAFLQTPDRRQPYYWAAFQIYVR